MAGNEWSSCRGHAADTCWGADGPLHMHETAACALKTAEPGRMLTAGLLRWYVVWRGVVGRSWEGHDWQGMSGPPEDMPQTRADGPLHVHETAADALKTAEPGRKLIAGLLG